MILEKQKEANVLETGNAQQSIGMSLDLDSAQILMQMLSKNLYSDAIGSTIRECASNALDSHRRAGVDKPIIVSFQRGDSNTFEFSVEDFGIGLDADDVEKIISKYGKSTKRDSATELGMMGLGFKAPLAYCSSFYFVARKNGVERKYMMYEGEDVNTIDLLYTRETTEGNGVKVIVPVTYYDKYDFIKKMKEQLAYFENVYFNVMDAEIKNDFVIFRGEDYQYSELASDSYMHICLDNVYYPIDFEKLGIKDKIDFPLALRFGLSDGIFPTPNRESIRYTPEAKDAIKKKIAKVADYFVNKYNESVEESDNIKAIMDFYSWNNRVYKSFNKNFDIRQIVPFATTVPKNPTLKGVKLLDTKKLMEVRDYWLQEYYCKVKISNGRASMIDGKYCYEFQPKNILDYDVYVYQGNMPGIKKDYLKTQYTKYNQNCLVVAKKSSLKLGTLKDRAYNSYNCYRNLLELDMYPKSEWRQRIQEFQYVISLITSKWKPLEDLVVPQVFIDSRKKPKATVSGPGKRRKISGEVVGKQAVELQRYVDGKNCKWESKNFNLEKLVLGEYLTIYGSHNDAADLDKLYSLFPRDKVRFVTFSEREMKIVQSVEAHNWMSYEEFMKGKSKMFRRAVTARLINKFRAKKTEVFSKYTTLEFISKSLYNDLETLVNYRNKWYIDGDSAMSDKMIEIAEKNNWYHEPVYSTLKKVEKLVDRLPFLNAMLCNMYRFTDEKHPMTNALCDLFKYYKVRVNLDKYKTNTVEEVSTEEN